MYFIASRISPRSHSWLSLLLLSIISPAAAQDLDSVSITGRVKDQTGAVILGSVVTAQLTAATGATRKTESASDGRYQLIQLHPGFYTVQVSSPGFAITTTTLQLEAGRNVQLDFVLLPESIVDVVTVSSDNEAVIDTTRTVVGGTLERNMIEALPIPGRGVLDLVFILPGVTEEPFSTRDLAEDRNSSPARTPEEAGVFALAGGLAYSNNITIDGLDNNDDRSARERFEPSIEAVEEVQIITNQFAAEYGRASGGRVNIRTRSGSQKFHGRTYYFFRDEALNANTFRNNELGLKRLPLQEHNPGFAIGGPLKLPGLTRNPQTFFFSSYEYDTLLDHALIDTLLPVGQNSLFELPSPNRPAGERLEDATLPSLNTVVAPYVVSVSTPLRNQKFSGRLDHRFSDTHNGTVAFHMGKLRNLRQFGGGNRLEHSLQPQARDSYAISYSDDFVFDASSINQFRGQLSRLRPGVRASGNLGPVVLIAINDPLMAGDPARRSGTLIAGGSTAGNTQRSERRIQLQNVSTLSRKQHAIKFGIDFQKIESTFTDLTDVSGTYNFASAGDFLANTPSRFRQTFHTTSTQRNTYLGLFVQDDWRMRNNVTLSFGLRYERESIIGDRDNLAPRFSLAVDPFNDGNTVIRFGGGIFYHRALLRTIDDFTLGTQHLSFDTNGLRNPSTGLQMAAAERREFIAANLQFPNVLRPDSDLVRDFAITDRSFSRRLDPELRIPESYQLNAGLERALGPGLVVEANYTFNRGLHLWREYNANAPVLPSGYNSFAEYLTSRDFANFRDSSSGLRRIFNATTAGELVRFNLEPTDVANPNSVGNSHEFGVSISHFNLNSTTSTSIVDVALAALRHLRPDPNSIEVEELIAAGNSFYHALRLELRQRGLSLAGSEFNFRAGYTLSRLEDDGIVNTSDALLPGAFKRERARSLLDRRHRFVFAGTFDLPSVLGRFRVAPVFRLASGAPFNISLGGVDRNLDDVSNDRPVYVGAPSLLRWRTPGVPLDQRILDSLSLPTIGTSGDLPRNAGHGPGLFLFDLSLSRDFGFNDRVRFRALMEFDNVLNKTVFSFGSEFINFNALSPTASPAQRQAFMDTFLVPTRTMRPRQLRLGLRISF